MPRLNKGVLKNPGFCHRESRRSRDVAISSLALQEARDCHVALRAPRSDSHPLFQQAQ